jgi:hypothetical protein
VTLTQAGDLVTPPQGAAPGTIHQGGAHQVPFNLDEPPEDIGPVHVQYNVIGGPHDPAAAEGQTPQPVDPSSLHDCFGDSASSSGDEPMDDNLSFVNGSATHGDVHDFCYRMLRLIRGGRKAAYRLQDQLQAWAARCDKTTDRVIPPPNPPGVPHAPGGGGGVPGRRYFIDTAAALAADAVLYAGGLPVV